MPNRSPVKVSGNKWRTERKCTSMSSEPWLARCPSPSLVGGMSPSCVTTPKAQEGSPRESVKTGHVVVAGSLNKAPEPET